MALSFDGTSAPTQGADAAVDSTGITVTLPSDTAAALIVASEDMLWRPGVHTGSATTWQSVPASVPMILHELDGISTIGVKAASTTGAVYLRALSPKASRSGR